MNIHHLVAMAPQGQGGGMVSTIFMFGLIIFIFYFMILRPQQKRQKERKKMLEAVKKGDRIVTVGGMHGTVVGVEDKTLLVQLSDSVKIKFDKSAVSSIVGGPEAQSSS